MNNEVSKGRALPSEQKDTQAWLPAAPIHKRVSRAESERCSVCVRRWTSKEASAAEAAWVAGSAEGVREGTGSGRGGPTGR